jgi:hypothetical protein
VQHNYGQRWGKFDDLSAAEQLRIRSRGDIVSGELLRAIADVVLTGSDDARQSAETLRRAALHAEDALEYGGGEDAEEPLEDLQAAIKTFIDAVRQSTALSELARPQITEPQTDIEPSESAALRSPD